MSVWNIVGSSELRCTSRPALHHPVDRVRREIGPAVHDRGRRGATREVDAVLDGSARPRRRPRGCGSRGRSARTRAGRGTSRCSGRAVLRRVAREVQSGLAREPEALEELLGRVGRLGRVHAEADHLVAPVRDDLLRSSAAPSRAGPGGRRRRSAGSARRSRARPARHPSIRPSMIVDIATPRVVCSVGLKNISRYLRLPSFAPSSSDSYAMRGEVALVDHGRVDQPEDLEELVDRLVVVDAVDVGGRAARCRACVASSATVCGRSVPSTWQCSSTFGRRRRYSA